MAPLVLLTAAERGDVVVAKRAGWRNRVTARLRANRLDTELARGVPPTHAALALRAQDLGERRTRERLGRSIRRILDDARMDRPPSIARVPTQRSEVLAAAWEARPDRRNAAHPRPGRRERRRPGTSAADQWRRAALLPDAPGGLRAAATRALDALQPGFHW